MKKIILFASASEILYLTLSFVIAHMYGQWSIPCELIRTSLRIFSIFFLGFIYQKYFFKVEKPFKTKETLTPPFIAATHLLLLFALTYTNAENETLLWQGVFFVSGLAAGLRASRYTQF